MIHVDDVLEVAARYWRLDTPVAMATVVATSQSAPREPGAAMLVVSTDEVVGSISGGCVEGSVYEVARSVLTSGTATLERYGISSHDAFAAGLTCGGTLDVFVERVDRLTHPWLDVLAREVAAGRPVASAVVVDHPDPAVIGRRLVVRDGEGASSSLGSILGDVETGAIAADVLGLLRAGRTELVEYGLRGERMGAGMRVFVQVFVPPPRMIIFGAIDFARATARIGSFLGFHVTICDARPLFATESRFPEADEVVVRWPHKYLESEAGRLDDRTVVCVLTHDPKFDVPVLEVALRIPTLAYVGAMGSRSTHADRLERLRTAGLGEQELARLHSPLGLDIGARTPEETAVSIAAEIVALRWGRTGAPLAGGTGAIHAPCP